MSVAEPASAAFELERFVAAGSRLEVTGRWQGVRGRRFVRPTLSALAGNARERALADLEHKPWAPRSDSPWVAAFDWPGAPAEVDEFELAVANDLAVRLGRPRPADEPHADASEPVSIPVSADQRRAPAATLRRPAEPASEPERPREQASRSERPRQQASESERQRQQALESERARREALAELDAARARITALTAARDAALQRGDDLAAERDAAGTARDRALAEREQLTARLSALGAELQTARREARAAATARAEAEAQPARPQVVPLPPAPVAVRRRPMIVAPQGRSDWVSRAVALTAVAAAVIVLLVLLLGGR